MKYNTIVQSGEIILCAVPEVCDAVIRYFKSLWLGKFLAVDSICTQITKFLPNAASGCDVAGVGVCLNRLPAAMQRAVKDLSDVDQSGPSEADDSSDDAETRRSTRRTTRSQRRQLQPHTTH